MTQKRLTAFSFTWWHHKMKIQRRIFLISIILICACSIHVASLPMVTFPLKPSPATGPFQDEEFLELANDTVYGLSNQTIPNGTALLDLQTTQQKLSKMNISLELYQTATQINAYLYYTAKARDTYSDAMSFYSKPYSPVYQDAALISEAREYQAASQIMWNRIQDLYPGVIPYRLETSTKPFSVNEDPDFKWPPHAPFSSYGHEGLW